MTRSPLEKQEREYQETLLTTSLTDLKKKNPATSVRMVKPIRSPAQISANFGNAEGSKYYQLYPLRQLDIGLIGYQSSTTTIPGASIIS